MEIQALRVLVTEQDINGWIARGMENNRRWEVRELRVRLALEGVYLSGVYEARIMDMPFETLWEVSVQKGRAVARLAAFRPLGELGGAAFGVADFLSKGSLRGFLLAAIAEGVRQEDAVRVDGDAVVFDLDRFLAKNGLAVETRLTALRCDAGRLFLEAGGSAGACAGGPAQEPQRGKADEK